MFLGVRQVSFGITSLNCKILLIKYHLINNSSPTECFKSSQIIKLNRKIIIYVVFFLMGSQSSRVTKMASSSEVQQFIKDAVSKDKVVVFSKTYCPYCTLAKDIFTKVKQPMTIYELDQRNDGTSIQETLSSITGFRTVPQVFINGTCVGGGSDVKALYESGRLEPLLVG